MATATTAPRGDGSAADDAKGWAVNAAGNGWHLGDFADTISKIVQTPKRFCRAILANTRDDASLDAMRNAIDAHGWTTRSGITDWPVGDTI